MIADPMGAASFRAAVEFLGLFTGRRRRPARRQPTDGPPLARGPLRDPGRVADEVRAWLDHAANLVERVGRTWRVRDPRGRRPD